MKRKTFHKFFIPMSPYVAMAVIVDGYNYFHAIHNANSKIA